MERALIIIDVQKGIDETMHWGGNRNNPEAEGNIKLLLSEWRSRKLPVVIVQHFSTSQSSPFHESRPGNALKDFIFVFVRTCFRYVVGIARRILKAGQIEDKK